MIPLFWPADDDMKSIGRSTTLPEDISDVEKAKLVLMELADRYRHDGRKA